MTEIDCRRCKVKEDTRKGCQDCKMWEDCFYKTPIIHEKTVDPHLDKKWFHYGEIRWCPYQVIWLIQNDELLEWGIWPPENVESFESMQYRNESYFVKAKLAHTELKARFDGFKTTETCGKTLRDEVIDGTVLQYLSQDAYDALMYLKGFDRKKSSFYDWNRSRRRNKRWNAP